MRKLNKLELLLVFVVLIIGIVRVVDTIELTPRRLFSVHDLNWDYFEEMNEFIVDATFSNPPYVFDSYVHGVGHLNVLLEFFKENTESLHDRQRNQRFDFTMRFSGITGDEKFLQNVPSSVWESSGGEFKFKFYIDRKIGNDFFTNFNEASWRRSVAEDSSLETRQTPFGEINWQDLISNYEERISGFIFEGFPREDVSGLREFFNIHSGWVSSDTILIIIQFLHQNQKIINEISYDGNHHLGVMVYLRETPESPRYEVTFQLTEDLYLELIDEVGFEIWDQVRIE